MTEHLPEKIELIDTPERREQYCIAIFGTGSEATAQDARAMEDARAIARVIADQRFSIATGGYDVGVMKAASETMAEVAKIRGEDPKRFVKSYPMAGTMAGPMAIATVKDAETVPSKTLNERLGHLVDESDGFVVLGGKFGTVTELVMALHSENVQQLRPDQPAARPILIVDPSMDHLDNLNMFVQRDQKLQKMAGLKNTYFIAGMDGWEEKAERILDLYYRKSLGQAIEKGDEAWLTEASYKYNFDNWLKNAEGVGYHL